MCVYTTVAVHVCVNVIMYVGLRYRTYITYRQPREY